MTTSAPPSPQAAAPSLAGRLGETCVELRPDLETSRHVFRGEVAYVLLDPVTFRSHRFALADYRILSCLRASRTLADTFAELLRRGYLEESDEERFYQFVFSLHKIGFLKLPISDEKTLYQRHLSRARAKRRQLPKSLLFLRIPVLDPDAFLSRTAALARPFFTRWAFALWLGVVGLSLWVVGRNWGEFTAPLGDIFRNENLPLLWVSLVVLKVAHELGHAYATKVFGGRVPEMGIFLMLFTPCAYVDASAAWGFSRKRERLTVCLAGMYVELFLAALAVLAWSVMPPGLWRSVLHNVVTLASVVTVAFNINPLMRYDGYYALSDLVEIPNLRSRAQQYSVAVLKRLVLGVRTAGVEGGARLRLFLLGFGVSSAVYKVGLVLGISATIALKFPALGLLLGGAYVLGELWSVLRRSIPYLWKAEETSPVRVWAMSLALLVVAGLPFAIAAVPVPSWVTTTGVVSTETEVMLRAESSGSLDELPVRVGDAVAPGATLARLSDLDAVARLEEARARLVAARVALEQARSLDPARTAQAEGRVRQLEEELAARRRDVDRLTVRSPLEGTATIGLDESEVGRYVKRGEPVASIVAGAPVVRALLTEEDVAAARPEPGTRVEFRTLAQPDRLLEGTVRRVVPSGRRQLDQPFARHLDPADYAVNPMTGKATRSQFEVEIELDDADDSVCLARGLTGKLRFEGSEEPMGLLLLRRMLTFMHRLVS